MTKQQGLQSMKESSSQDIETIFCDKCIRKVPAAWVEECGREGDGASHFSLSFFFFLPLISLEVSLRAGPGPSPH